jgi:N-acetylglucosaminyldiphosphoundecaprenol N-acetyl-beta-D-mannosaminyltransferase
MKALKPDGPGPVFGGLPERVNLGGLWCSRCTPRDLAHVVDELVRNPTVQPRTVAFVNAHVFLSAYGEDAGLYSDLQNAAVVAVDGISIALASWVLNCRWVPRCVMTQAFDEYVTYGAGADARAILAGASEPEAQAAAAAIHRQSPHLRIDTALSGHLPLEEYARVFETSKDTDLVLLGMGSPRTETVMRLATERCRKAVIWHIGAGTFKYYAGTKKRTPRWIHACGLQWLHRMVLEPHTRKRYLAGIPRFAWLLARLRVGHNSQPPGTAEHHPA